MTDDMLRAAEAVLVALRPSLPEGHAFAPGHFRIRTAILNEIGGTEKWVFTVERPDGQSFYGDDIATALRLALQP